MNPARIIFTQRNDSDGWQYPWLFGRR